MKIMRIGIPDFSGNKNIAKTDLRIFQYATTHLPHDVPHLYGVCEIDCSVYPLTRGGKLCETPGACQCYIELMELCDGSFEQYLKKHQVLPALVEQMFKLAIRLGDKQIIHNDFKAANVLYKKNDEKAGSVRLLATDFGFSQIATEQEIRGKRLYTGWTRNSYWMTYEGTQYDSVSMQLFAIICNLIQAILNANEDSESMYTDKLEPARAQVIIDVGHLFFVTHFRSDVWRSIRIMRVDKSRIPILWKLSNLLNAINPKYVLFLQQYEESLSAAKRQELMEQIKTDDVFEKL